MPLIPINEEAKNFNVTDEPKFGTVVDNNDPDKLGKIKVTIPGIFEGSIDKLPWIRRKNDTAFCGDDAELFDVPAIAVDTHVERVSKRLGLANSTDSVLEVENTLMNQFSPTEYHMVHHLLLFFGRYQCFSRNPKCADCKLKQYCGYLLIKL